MTHLLIHGVYDLSTLEVLMKLGVRAFSFDLRGKSLNLVKMSDFLNMSNHLKDKKVFLMFESDPQETILSFLDLLKKTSIHFHFVQSGDHHTLNELGLSYDWVFDDTSDWETILSHQNLRGLWLPLKYKNLYEHMPLFWKKIEEKKLDVTLYAENFSEAENVDLSTGPSLCVGLTGEVESSYRKIDIEKLENLSFWEKIS